MSADQTLLTKNVLHRFKAHNTALVIIHPQISEAHPGSGRGNTATDKAAQNIQALCKIFRKAGIPIYVCAANAKTPEQARFHHYEFAQGRDTFIPTPHENATVQTDLVKHLKSGYRQNLFVVGFHTSMCLMNSAISLRTGRQNQFNVAVLSNCTADGENWKGRTNTAQTKMEGHGISFAHSAEALQQLGITTP